MDTTSDAIVTADKPSMTTTDRTMEEFIASEAFEEAALAALAAGIREAVADDKAQGRPPFATK